MDFDIYQLDAMDASDSDMEESVREYQEALIEQFALSAEGQSHQERYPDIGFWIAQLIYYGYGYLGVSVPQMMVSDVDEIVTELFPRKISLSSPEDADEAIPELVAFWHYLAREYQLAHAEHIIQFLKEIQPTYRDIINDPAKFGMAKSFFMMGQSSGFDMTDEEESHEFMLHYNRHLLSQEPEVVDEAVLSLMRASPEMQAPPDGSRHGSKHPSKQKKRRQMRKASRKRNRRKRK